MIKTTKNRLEIDEDKVFRFKLFNQSVEIEFNTSVVNFGRNFMNAYLDARLKDKNDDLRLALFNGQDWNILKNEKGTDTLFPKNFSPVSRLRVHGEVLAGLFEYRKARGLLE